MNEQTNLIVKVDYEEFQPDTYKGIEVLDYKNNEVMKINTGKFNFDWEIIGDFIKAFIKENPTVEINVSSSVDNYIADSSEVKTKKEKTSEQVNKLAKIIAEGNLKLKPMEEIINSTTIRRNMPTPIDFTNIPFKK